MQRLYSTFPNSWPGFGLLLIRVTLGLYLVAPLTKTSLSTGSDWIVSAVEVLLGTALSIGLWTPLAAVAQAIFLLYAGWLAGVFYPDPLLRIVVGLGVAMLGPGSFSLDSRLFGRKRIEVSLRQ